MSVVGRSLGGSLVQLQAVLDTDITSTEETRAAYFNTANSEWELLTSVDLTLLQQNLLAVISRVTVDGDGLGAQGSGFVVINGTIPKSGATAGEVFFIAADGTTSTTPPGSGAAVRIGHSHRDGFMFVDIDADTIQLAILQDQVTDLQTQVDELVLANQVVPVYDFGNGSDNWGVSPETTNTDFGLDDSWTEGTVEYNANFGADDAWGELVPA
jgi:hypothetical protein